MEGVASNVDEVIAFYKNVDVSGIFIKDLSKISKKDIILDVGFGAGNLLSFMKLNEYDKVLGFDIDKRIVKAAKNRSIRDIFVADANNIPIRSDAINYIICSNLIEHISTPRIMLKSIQRILKKDGFLYLLIPKGYSLNDILLRLGGKIFRGRTSHIHVFKKKDVLKLLEFTDYEVLEINNVKGFALFKLPIWESILPRKIFNILEKVNNLLAKFLNYGWEVKAIKVEN